MICKCGSEIAERNHKVVTVNGAKDWLPDHNDQEIKAILPLNIEQRECQCGRYGYRVLSGLKLIFSRI